MTAALLLIASALASPLNRDPEGIGVGLVVGDPSGLSFGIHPENRTWFDAAVAWNFESDAFHIHGDALYTLTDLQSPDMPDLHFPVWVGLGPSLSVASQKYNGSQTVVGLRIPVAMAFRHDNVPIELFLEVAPTVNLYPSTNVDLTGGFGVRYYLALQ